MHRFFSLMPLTLLLVVVLSTGVLADELRLVSTVWEPYAGLHQPRHGFTSEIIAAALQRAGHKVSFHFRPWKRAMEETKFGKFDGLYSAYYSKERARTYALTEPYAESEVVLCARSDFDGTFSSLKDLTPYMIGVVRGYVNSPEFDQADYLKKEEVTNDLLNLRMLIAKRVDLIVIDKYVAIHYLKNVASLEGDLPEVRFLSPPLIRNPIYLMFSRVIPNYEQKVDDFNRGLREITLDGTLDEILNHYGFEQTPKPQNPVR